MTSIKKNLFFASLLCIIVSCNATKKLTSIPTTTGFNAVKFLGQYIIPYNLAYNNTTVGGLSGIDYDAADDKYFLICDDRSAVNPARFYTAHISFTQKGIDTVYFTGVQTLLQQNGSVYPSSKQDPYHTPDPEAIRFNLQTRQLIWTSEGERIVKDNNIVLENPAIISITEEGKYIDSFSLTHSLIMQNTENGPRQNGVLEGLTFSDNFKNLYVNVEEPLYEDGPRADITDNNAFIRIFKFDVNSRQNTQQVAYKLEPVAHAANPANEFKINGIPDILYLGDNKMLVIERSFSTGRLACTIKLFLADLNNATDIKNIPSLKLNNSFVPVTKKLLLNMDDLGIYIDNVEGVTFGPVLPNGHRTLLFVADNNFNPLEKTQFLLFEVME